MRSITPCLAILIYTHFALSENEFTTAPENATTNEKPKLMKAIVINNFGWSDVLKVQDIPIPTDLTQTQVLVKVRAAGISPVDTYMRAGTYRIKPSFPAILGKEVAGVVEEIGSSVPKYKPGDRVFCCIEMGGYAQYVAVDYNDCFPLSEKLTFSQGAALCMTYFAAHRALILKGCTREEDTVLIHGASGGLGTACVQMAKSAGAKVVATVGDFSVSELMKTSGADKVIYHNKHYYLDEAIKDLGKPGFDVILDILTSANLQHDRNYLNKNGRVVVFGKHMPVTISEDYIKESYGSMHRISLTQYTRRQQQVAAEFIINGVQKSFISPIIGSEYSIDEGPLAHNDIMSSRSATGKLVFLLP